MTNRPTYENSHNMCKAMHVRGHTTGHRATCSWRPPPATHSVCKGHNGSDNGAGQDPGGDRKEVLDNCFVLAPLFLLSTTLLLLLLLSVPPSISAPSLFSLLLIWSLAAFLIYIGAKSGHYHHPHTLRPRRCQKNYVCSGTTSRRMSIQLSGNSRRQRVQ